MLRQLFKAPEYRAGSAFATHGMAEPIVADNRFSSHGPSSNPVNSVASRAAPVYNTGYGSAAVSTAANRIVDKANPAPKLARELARPGYNPAPITLGSNKDPYGSCEPGLKATRELLELLLKHRHPVHIVTKSHLIVKDLDLLTELARLRLCTVVMCVNTLNNELGGKIEPRTSSPAARIKTIARLTAAGIPVGVMMAPVIPVVNDGELEDLLRTVKEAGAITAAYEFLSLPDDVTGQFNHWLQRHFPDQAQRIFGLSQAHLGKSGVNSSAVEFASMVNQRFRQTCLSLGLNRTGLPALDTTRFIAPGATA